MALLLLWDFETGFVDIVTVMVISTLLEALQVYCTVVVDSGYGGHLHAARGAAGIRCSSHGQCARWLYYGHLHAALHLHYTTLHYCTTLVIP